MTWNTCILTKMLKEYFVAFALFGSTQNFKDCLTRSKICPLKRIVDSEKYLGLRCLVCLNLVETDRFESFQTKKLIQNCNGKCLVHFLFCKCCILHYVGSTTDIYSFWSKKCNTKKPKRRKSFKKLGTHEAWLTLSFSLLCTY